MVKEVEIPFMEKSENQESICEMCGQDCETTDKCLFKELD